VRRGITSEKTPGDILDRGPKASGGPAANMLVMNRPAANSSVSLPRRFILLPEETADRAASRPRIRRYQLTGVGRGAGRGRAILSDSEVSTARMACELGRLGSS
jgi:hypothetical protein